MIWGLEALPNLSVIKLLSLPHVSWLFLPVLALLSLSPDSKLFLLVFFCSSAHLTPTCQQAAPTCTYLSKSSHSYMSPSCSYPYFTVLVLSFLPVSRLPLPVLSCPSPLILTCQQAAPTCTYLSLSSHSYLSAGCSNLHLAVLRLSILPVSRLLLPVLTCPSPLNPTCHQAAPTCTYLF